MAAVVTDQFRILNADNFINSVLSDSNSYYVFAGLANPTITGFGRTDTWNNENDVEKNPIDNLDYLNHYKETSFFGKKITSSNIRRVIRKVSWTANTNYDMYRHDYSSKNPTPNSGLPRLYDSNFYVVNSDYRVYICIDNVSSGDLPKGKVSEVEPIFTDIEPTTLSDGYTWKYLFSISPSDIIKFDSTEYVVVPNNWSTSTDSQIQTIRESGDSDVNLNQIKKVYIQNGGAGYALNKEETCNINGDGSGAKVVVKTDGTGKIKSAKVVSGGSGYTYGFLDLNPVRKSGINPTTFAKLIPIIPPSKGHGYDVYRELGADRILIYARFDDSTRDFPTSSKFAQIGIIKNPQSYSGNSIFNENQFSSLYALKINISGPVFPIIGEKIQGSSSNILGYVASYDKDTGVLKYYVDRSLSFSNSKDSTDSNSNLKLQPFMSGSITGKTSSFSASIDTSFGSSSPTSIFDGINLGATFVNGVANPEINRKTGDIIYIDNRTLVSRDSRQKEDVKIILEF